MLHLRDKVVLITGGSGSLGNALVSSLCDLAYPFIGTYDKSLIKKILIYSRSELPQVEMERKYPSNKYPVRYFLGDVRDKNRLHMAMNGVDYVIHCAAIKHVDKAQYNPFETVQTNIIGAQNVIEAAINQKVSKVLAVSSDKAVNPCNLYGATKLCSDFMFIDANVYSPKGTKFSVIRFGNFWGSSGSFVELVLRLKQQGIKKIPITHPGMIRYFIPLEQAAERALQALGMMRGGEVMIPEMKQCKIVDIANEIYPEAEHEVVGVRPGEKMSEELVFSGQELEFKNGWATIKGDI